MILMNVNANVKLYFSAHKSIVFIGLQYMADEVAEMASTARPFPGAQIILPRPRSSSTGQPGARTDY